MTFRKWERFIGETARPWVLILSAGSSAIATVAIVARGMDLAAGAVFVAAAWAGTATLFGAKAAEETRKAARRAEVEVAQAEAKK